MRSLVARLGTLRGALLTAFLLRALLPLLAYLATGDESIFYWIDSTSYVDPATTLLAQGVYESGGAPELLRPPGYPLLLLPGLALGALVPLTLALQIAAAVLTVWLAYRSARLLFDDERPALTAAWLLACEPLSIVYASKIVSETLCALLLVTAVWLLLRYLRTARLRLLVLSALALAGTAFVRPVFYYLPFLVAAALVLRALRARGSRALWLVHVLVFGGASLGPLAAWQVRNYVRAGYPGFSSFEAFNLYLGVGGSVRAAREGKPYWAAVRDLMKALPGSNPLRQGAPSPSVEVTRRMGAEGWRLFAEAPGAYVRPHFEGIARMLLHPGLGEYLLLFGHRGAGGVTHEIADRGLLPTLGRLARERPAFLAGQVVLGLCLLATLALALCGALARSRWRGPGRWAVFLVVGYVALVSGGPLATHRYRQPLMPLFCVLAGAGVVRLRERLASRRAARGPKTSSLVVRGDAT